MLLLQILILEEEDVEDREELLAVVLNLKLALNHLIPLECLETFWQRRQNGA